jgi:signal peptidase
MTHASVSLQASTALPARASLLVAGAVLAVAAALVAANAFAFEVVPERFTELWGPYGLAGAGWLTAAAVALLVGWRLPRLPLEGQNERAAVLQAAVIVGVYLVVVQLLIGVFAGFGRSPFEHTPKWLAINAFLGLAPVAAIEAARLVFLRGLGRRSLTLALVVSSLALVAARLPVDRFAAEGFPAQAEFWGGTFIPAAALGLIAGIYALYGGLRASLLVAVPLVAFQYLSPALPAGDWPLLALAGVAGPATALWMTESLFASTEAVTPAEERGGWFSRLGAPSVGWTVTAVIALAIFWFTFGFYGFQPAFIPSRSMEPLLNRGDVVLIGPIEADDVRVGDIVLYELGPHVKILHRVIEVRETPAGQRQFITKGDNNNTDDLLPVDEHQLRGEFLGSIPKVGWLPLRLSEWLREHR